MCKPSSSPWLSIVCVVKDDAQGLQRTVDSVIGQSFDSWEMMLKPAPSSDETQSLALAMAQNHHQISLISGQDSGLYDAMNIALKQAAGAYLLMLNAGDVLASGDSLQGAYDCIGHDIQSPDIAFFDTQVRVEGGRGYLRKARNPSTVRYGQPAIHQSTLFRTMLHQQFPYLHEVYPSIADYVSLAMMMKAGASAKRYNQTLSIFEVTRHSASFVHQARARAEFDRAIAQIWALPAYLRLFFRVRRWLAQQFVRMLVR
ncbi:MAG: glycosyltransferase [Devosiaceae bacterium]